MEIIASKDYVLIEPIKESGSVVYNIHDECGKGKVVSSHFEGYVKGDTVFYLKYEIKVDGTNYVFVKLDNILGKYEQ